MKPARTDLQACPARGSPGLGRNPDWSPTFVVMPWYFFHVRDIPPTQDAVGAELLDDEAAWRQVTTLAGEVFKDVDGRIRPDQEWGLEVTDQDGASLFQIDISTKKLKQG